VRGTSVSKLAAHEVTAAAQAACDPLASDTIDLFSSLLGNVAGNLALTLGARGGVYVGGGIVQRLGRHFNAARFRQSFEAKGRFRDFLSQIPSFIILSTEQAALKGASRALDAGLAR
jgi:glucokinase